MADKFLILETNLWLLPGENQLLKRKMQRKRTQPPSADSVILISDLCILHFESGAPEISPQQEPLCRVVNGVILLPEAPSNGRSLLIHLRMSNGFGKKM